MITLISATNNTGSYTKVISQIYFEELKKHTAGVLFFSLEEMNRLPLSADMYHNKPEWLLQMEKKYFDGSDKFLFVIPEYNGSYPGILKMLFDAMDVRKSMHGKKAAIVGVATGRQGNLRGIDQLTAVLAHMQISVMPKFFPLSSVQHELDENGVFKNEKTIASLRNHAESFLKY